MCVRCMLRWIYGVTRKDMMDCGVPKNIALSTVKAKK